MSFKLDAPPIIEVMCGIAFDPLRDLDPVAVGGWWHEMKPAYPFHLVQPAVSDGPGIFVGQGAGPLRTWLVSSDDEWVIQVQPDRFYVNWRRRRGTYPRFSDHDDQEGVMTRALREYEQFRTYCHAQLGTAPAATAVELAKVDLIVEGEHWRDLNDLASVMPLIADISRFARSSELELGLNLSELTSDGGFLQTSVSLTTEAMSDGNVSRAVKLETRGHRRLLTKSNDMRPLFAALNDDVNTVFFGLFSDVGLQRFAKEGQQ